MNNIGKRSGPPPPIPQCPIRDPTPTTDSKNHMDPWTRCAASDPSPPVIRGQPLNSYLNCLVLFVLPFYPPISHPSHLIPLSILKRWKIPYGSKPLLVYSWVFMLSENVQSIRFSDWMICVIELIIDRLLENISFL